MGKHEVTVCQFHLFADATVYRTDADEGRDFTGALYAGAEAERASETPSPAHPNHHP